MCYDAATMAKKAAKYAQRYGKEAMWEVAKQQSPPLFHVTGFDEPDLPVITNDNLDTVQFFQWGFVPFVYVFS